MDYPELARAIAVIGKLRDPEGGCPWDLRQTHSTLLRFLIEESYEYIYAVDQDDPQKMEEELGDVLLQVLLHAKIASEKQHFDIESVAKKLADKMVHRHPHVFEDPAIARTEAEVKANWNQLKQSERKNEYHIRIEDAYSPALHASDKIGAKSQAVNFDWDNIQDVLAKVEEELAEVKVELKKTNNSKAIFEEMGDLLFSVAQLARHSGFSPEEALKQANLKFIKRINIVEDKVKADGQRMQDLSTETLEQYWSQVKQEIKAQD